MSMLSDALIGVLYAVLVLTAIGLMLLAIWALL